MIDALMIEPQVDRAFAALYFESIAESLAAALGIVDLSVITVSVTTNVSESSTTGNLNVSASVCAVIAPCVCSFVTDSTTTCTRAVVCVNLCSTHLVLWL